jgi:nicotinamide riboside transporter PnuC
MKAKLLEYVGAGFGIVGAALLALNNHYSPFAYIFFLASSFFLVIFSLKNSARGLLLMQVAFTLVNLIGIYRWILHPGMHA